MQTFPVSQKASLASRCAACSCRRRWISAWWILSCTLLACFKLATSASSCGTFLIWCLSTSRALITSVSCWRSSATSLSKSGTLVPRTGTNPPSRLPWTKDMGGPLGGGRVQTLMQLSLYLCLTLVGYKEVGLYNPP